MPFYISFIHFYETDKYQDAIEYRNRQRRMTPPLYNEARANERPLPQLNHPDLDNNDGAGHGLHADDDIAHEGHNESVDQHIAGPSHANGAMNQSVAGPSHSNGATDHDSINGTTHHTHEVLVEGPNGHDSNELEITEENPLLEPIINDDGLTDQGSINGTTHHIHEVLVEETNGLALNELEMKEEDPLLEPINDDLQEIEEMKKLTEYHCEVIDDDMTIFFESEQAFKPKATTLQFKSNDVFSGSIPYRVNVSNHYLYNITTNVNWFYLCNPRAAFVPIQLMPTE